MRSYLFKTFFLFCVTDYMYDRFVDPTKLSDATQSKEKEEPKGMCAEASKCPKVNNCFWSYE